jgi:sugar diacid utilization regulator
MRDPRPVRATMRKWNVRGLLGVPMITGDTVRGLLYFDDEGCPADHGTETLSEIAAFANVAAIALKYVTRTASLRASLESVAGKNRALLRAARVESSLTAMVLDGAPLPEIAAAVMRFTGKPCWIHGADGRILAKAAASGSDDSPRALDARVRAHPDVAAALAELRPDVPTVVGPFPSAGAVHRFLVGPVNARGEGVGQVVLKESGTRFTSFDAHVVRRAATVLALELSAIRRVAAAHAQACGPLLRDLVAGVGEDSGLFERAAAVGLELGEPHVLCLVRDEAGHAPTADEVHAALRGRPEALVARVQDGVVVVLPAAPGDEDSAITEAVALMDSAWLAAVSEPFSGAAGFARAYQEALQVTRCVATFGSPEARRATAVSEVGSARLFLASTSRSDADRFVQETLGPLAAPDSQSLREFLVTLTAFCASSFRVRPTALRLGVHENTVRYRLVRIAELTQLDVVANSDHQIACHIATLVMSLEGRLPE